LEGFVPLERDLPKALSNVLCNHQGETDAPCVNIVKIGRDLEAWSDSLSQNRRDSPCIIGSKGLTKTKVNSEFGEFFFDLLLVAIRPFAFDSDLHEPGLFFDLDDEAYPARCDIFTTELDIIEKPRIPQTTKGGAHQAVGQGFVLKGLEVVEDGLVGDGAIPDDPDLRHFVGLCQRCGKEQEECRCQGSSAY
jgi:hypothetical protein